MKELVVLSGKGGTGKTSIVASFAALAKDIVLADCDVDAADLHLVSQPDVKQTHDFIGGKQASIVTEKCIGCGKCQELCRFDAVKFDGKGNNIIEKTFTIDPISCEGCKVCVEFCPADAIEFNDSINGRWFVSQTRFGPMVHAKLGIAEENSGKLVTLIRKKARQIAETKNQELLLVDGSPGIGCPVIASITGADFVLIVTEPTLSGKHDLQRVAELTANFKIPTLLCINKADINPQITQQIEKDAEQQGIKIAGKIRYSDAFTKAQITGCSVVEYTKQEAAEDIKELWENIRDIFSTE